MSMMELETSTFFETNSFQVLNSMQRQICFWFFKSDSCLGPCQTSMMGFSTNIFKPSTTLCANL